MITMKHPVKGTADRGEHKILFAFRLQEFHLRIFCLFDREVYPLEAVGREQCDLILSNLRLILKYLKKV